MARQFSTACERNREPIFEVLAARLPASGTLLEVASGTGMHAAFMAPKLPAWTWQPSDVNPEGLASIEAWRRETDAPNLRAPVELDVTRQPWPIEHADAIFNANMIHISPWACTLGLLDGAAAVLPEGAPLFTYGPYLRRGYTAPSNARFDQSLRARDPSWGVRELDRVQEEAEARGLALEEVVEMPASNLILVFRRGPA